MWLLHWIFNSNEFCSNSLVWLVGTVLYSAEMEGHCCNGAHQVLSPLFHAAFSQWLWEGHLCPLLADRGEAGGVGGT
jgi:hypothetical protein